MKNILFLISGLALLLLNSCNDPWETRFDGNINPADNTIWETIDANPAYNDFKNLLVETGYDSILKRNATFTVIIPGSEALSQLKDSSASVKKLTLSYHISNDIFFSKEMPLGHKLLTLSGKTLLFEKIGDKLMVNKDAEVTAVDIRSSNGVIHEINKVQLVRPNILEIIYSSPEYSYIADFFAQGTSQIFDQENSIPIGIDENGLTIYDSLWIQSNPFFSVNGNIGSETEQFAIFLANNTLLDTSQAGEYKIGYFAKFAGFLVPGNFDPLNLPEYFISADGSKIELVEGAYEFLQSSSNGPVFEIKDLKYYTIPKKLLWEITSVSDFDSIRGIKSYEYAPIYDQLTQIIFKDFSSGGSLSNAKYEKLTGPLNKDYFKVIPAPGTLVTMDIKLPDIIPGKYNITLRASKRATDGALLDIYLNNALIKSGVSLNGGLYTWEDFDLGDATFSLETGDILTFKFIDAIKKRLDFDYLIFEPTN
ncbi:MAG: fasciclin domain-containing protein [Bacteroidales bacterium]|nr:fasciclin domain-containing protein [Bacteroidales bacterium]MCF8389889.1 fasciclin domain-containing protein [Bacteroidales bacterium]